MGMNKIDLLQGTLDLLILKTLSGGPMHGYRIAARIQQLSDEVLRIEEGLSTLPCIAWSRKGSSNPSGACPKITGRRSFTSLLEGRREMDASRIVGASFDGSSSGS